MSTPKHQSPPLPVGITLDRGFSLLRRNPRALLVPQLVFGLLGVLIVVVGGLITYLALGDVHTHYEDVRSSTAFGDSTLSREKVADFTDGQTVIVVIAVVLFYLVYGLTILASTITVVRAADRAIEGQERLGLKAAVKDGARQTPKLFGLSIVFGIMALLYLIAVGIVIAVVAQIASGLAVLLGIAAFVLTVWLWVRLLLWPFVSISEGTSFSSYGRAWALTKGRFWALFGVLILVAIVVTVVSVVVVIVLALIVSAISSIGNGVGVVAAIPYLLGSVLIGLVATAGYISPIVVSYRTLAGRDNADLWQAATAMGGGAPAADPGVRRWDATEAPIGESAWDGPARAEGASADAPPSGSQRLGGLPASDEPSDAERRWGRGDERPTS